MMDGLLTSGLTSLQLLCWSQLQKHQEVSILVQQVLLNISPTEAMQSQTFRPLCNSLGPLGSCLTFVSKMVGVDARGA